MGKTITEKIIEAHLVTGRFIPGTEIAIRPDQTLTPDSTGTMAYLQFESMNVPRVRTELSVSYIDHNTLQIGFENPDDHLYLTGIARKHGIVLSRAGNGICHHVHLERFGKPGKTLIGADSHTPTGGALGMIAIGAGGLDVALAMAGDPFYFTCPQVIRVTLTGRLRPWVSAKDIVLKVLEIFTTKGNVGCVLEYGGEGLATLTVPERATIANMGTECGVTTSVFPSDGMTRRFLRAQQREEDWRDIQADPDGVYLKTVKIDLSELVPLTAKPHSPDQIATVREIGGIPVQQVCIGSCTNSSYKDLVTVARILKGKVVHPDVSLVIAPGSRQILLNLERDGYLADFFASGARLMETACGFCVGIGQSPPTNGVSLRTSNRNFFARSGTQTGSIYLVSPETAAAAALTARFTDPRDLGMDYPEVEMPELFHVDDRMFLRPEETPDPSSVEIVRGPNIGKPPKNDPLPETIRGEVAIKLGDKITTDHITPAGDLLKYRSNIPKYSEFVFKPVDGTFYERALKNRDAGRHNIIVAGLSYGQGSSREHAAICPMFLGVKAIIARSFERIHAANLINFGIIPLTFGDADPYDRIAQGDEIEIPAVRNLISSGGKFTIRNITRGEAFEGLCELTERQKALLLAGGALNLKK
jgi:aconitate hydratase